MGVLLATVLALSVVDHVDRHRGALINQAAGDGLPSDAPTRDAETLTPPVESQLTPPPEEQSPPPAATDHVDEQQGALTGERPAVPPVIEGSVLKAWSYGMLGVLLGVGFSFGGVAYVFRTADTDALLIIGSALSVFLGPATAAFVIDQQLNDEHSTFNFTTVVFAGVGTYALVVGTALYFALFSVLPISPVLLVLAAAVGATVATPAVQVLAGLMTRQWKPAEAQDPALVSLRF